jgi:hypothetical protein
VIQGTIRDTGYNLRNSETRLNLPKPRTNYLKGHCDGKLSCLFIVYSESISVDKQSYQISASNSISFCLFFQRKHANFSAAITELDVDFLGGCDVIYSTRFFPEGEIKIIKGLYKAVFCSKLCLLTKATAPILQHNHFANSLLPKTFLAIAGVM